MSTVDWAAVLFFAIRKIEAGGFWLLVRKDCLGRNVYRWVYL